MSDLLLEVRKLILSARKAVVHSVDLIQVLTNFEIGRRIVEHEQQGSERAEYGKALLKELSAALTAEFGRGFSRSNLEYMRKFYLTYQGRAPRISGTPFAEFWVDEKSQTPSGKLVFPRKSQTLSGKFATPFNLSWSQYVFLISIDNPEERRFYEIEASAGGWTLPELKRQFNSGLYERLALNRDQDEVRKLVAEGQIISRPEDLLKEPYVLEFLGLGEKEKYSESDLESAIIDKLEHFLLELGKGFLFEARQKRFIFDEEHFFIDLVFYNRLDQLCIDAAAKPLLHSREVSSKRQGSVNPYDYNKTTGDKLTKEILDIRSDMPIILCTGHSDRISEDSAKDIGLAKYLKKPLDMQALAASVREVLDRQLPS